MKRLLFIFIAILFIGIQANARTRNLNKLPEAKRDSVLLAVAKEAMLKYAPEWYSDKLIPETKYLGYTDHPDYKHRQLYRVTYFLPDKKPMPEPFNWKYLISVLVWEDTGKLLSITFGTSGISLTPDNHPDLPLNELIAPWPEGLPRPF